MDSLIIVIDSESAKTINVYNTNGKFSHKIGAIGNGPEEFAEISNVVMIPNSNVISVLDRLQKKILYFNLDGRFLKYEKQPFAFNYYEYLDSGNRVYNIISMYDPIYGKNRGKSLIVTDSMNHIKYGAFQDTYRENFIYLINRPLRKFGTQVFFSPNLTDSIYIVENENIVPKYYIDLKNHSMSKINKKNLTNETLNNLMNTHFFFNGDFIELQDFTFINIATPWSYPFAIYSHKHKEVYLTNGEFDNPLYSFLEYAPIARYQRNGILFIIDPYILMDVKKSLYDNNKNYEGILDDLFRDLEFDSNPILFIYHINPNLGEQ